MGEEREVNNNSSLMQKTFATPTVKENNEKDKQSSLPSLHLLALIQFTFFLHSLHMKVVTLDLHKGNGC